MADQTKNWRDRINDLLNHPRDGRTPKTVLVPVIQEMMDEIDRRLPVTPRERRNTSIDHAVIRFGMSSGRRKTRCEEIRDEIIANGPTITDLLVKLEHLERCTHWRTKSVDRNSNFGAHLKCDICGHLARRSADDSCNEWFSVQWDPFHIINEMPPVSQKNTDRRMAERRLRECSVFSKHNFMRRKLQRRK